MPRCHLQAKGLGKRVDKQPEILSSFCVTILCEYIPNEAVEQSILEHFMRLHMKKRWAVHSPV